LTKNEEIGLPPPPEIANAPTHSGSTVNDARP
jgi:hypothetical protein